jgi:hypothetical protein
MSRTLGAILAGGRSRRFGSDKALARLGGERLIDRAAAALRPQVDRLIVCGRVMPAMVCVADRPSPDLGPLGGLGPITSGGLNCAIHYCSTASRQVRSGVSIIQEYTEFFTPGITVVFLMGLFYVG